ncbi:MAG: hypothetical protein ACXAB7_21490 [Candidatus Kariarchaeaceae archaeon]|jgi:hypothetical protein
MIIGILFLILFPFIVLVYLINFGPKFIKELFHLENRGEAGYDFFEPPDHPDMLLDVESSRIRLMSVLHGGA